MENNNNTNIENNGANNTSSNNNQTNSNNIDMAHLEAIINKGISQKENSILKSFFQEQGLDEAQVKEAISSYKANKKQEETKNTKEFEDLTNNYANLQKELNQERINNAINLNLMKKGLTDEQIPYISKMVGNDILVDGKVDETKLEESIEAVFKAFPNLVPKKEENKSFVQIGATNNNSDDESETDYLRKIFGLK